MSEEIVQLADSEVIVSVDDVEVIVSVDESVVDIETSGPPGPQGPPGPPAAFLNIEYALAEYHPESKHPEGTLVSAVRQVSDTGVLWLSGLDRWGNDIGHCFKYLTPWDTILLLNSNEHNRWVRFLVLDSPVPMGGYHRLAVRHIADSGYQLDPEDGLVLRIPQTGFEQQPPSRPRYG